MNDLSVLGVVFCTVLIMAGVIVRKKVSEDEE